MSAVYANLLFFASLRLFAVPWRPRDPGDFTQVELGYAWRGPRGAVLAATRLLVAGGQVETQFGRGDITPTGKPLPRGGDRWCAPCSRP